MSILTSAVPPVSVGHVYTFTNRLKAKLETFTAVVTSVEDLGDSWYFGFVPTDGYAAYGSTSISKPGHETNFGIESVEHKGQSPAAKRYVPLPRLKGNPSFDLMM